MADKRHLADKKVNWYLKNYLKNYISDMIIKCGTDGKIEVLNN